MTDNQTHLLLKAYANQLQTIRDRIAEQLPDEMIVTKQVRPLMRFKDTPEFITVTNCPVLADLDGFISDLMAEAKDLRESALKQKERAR